jgi:hypothetical protein
MQKASGEVLISPPTIRQAHKVPRVDTELFLIRPSFSLLLPITQVLPAVLLGSFMFLGEVLPLVPSSLRSLPLAHNGRVD